MYLLYDFIHNFISRQKSQTILDLALMPYFIDLFIELILNDDVFF